MHILVYIGSAALILISLLHFYWMFGTRGLEKAVPRNKSGSTVAPPKPIILLSALMFLAAGLLPLAALGIIPLSIPRQAFFILLILGLLAFIIRGVLGLILSLKSNKPRTEFNRLNIALYTPIIAVLAIAYLATLLLL